MKLTKISTLLFSFILSAFAYANEEVHKIIKSQSKKLELLVGRPFEWNDPQLRIWSTNSKGETVGEAYFKNSTSNIGNREVIAWYWHPESGFIIIASGNELLNAFEKDLTKPFLFYQMFINESGIVACSFLVDQKEYNVCPWLWWSLNEGLHLSNEPTSYQLVTRLNNNGYVLIREFLEHGNFKLYIKNLEDDENLYTYEFNPRTELTSTYKIGFGLLPGEMEKYLVEMVFKYTNVPIKKVNHFDWYPFEVDEFSDDLNIKGHGSVITKFLRRIYPFFWKVYIVFEIRDGNAKFLVEKITEEFRHNPRRFTDIDNKIIFEKNFSD